MRNFLFAFISTLFVIQLAPQALANNYETLAAYEKKITHVNINKDGSYEEVEEYTILIKSQQAVDAWSQAEISFSSDHQTLEVLEAYTILPDGQKIKVADNAIRTVDDEVSSGAAMFSDLKTKIIIFPNVKVGAKIYYKVKLVEHTPNFPNHFLYSQHFSPTVQFDHAEMNFTYPKSMPMRVETRDVSSQRTETNNSITYRFVFQQSRVRLKEPAQVSLIDFAPAIYLSTFKDYLEYGQAYEARAKDKAEVTKNVQQLANDITKDISYRKAQARALYNWVSKEIRYVAIYMGNGGVVPHAADDIIRNRYGDCKDKNTLLIALLNAKGIQASSAVINSGNAYTLPIIPVFSPFNHVITYLPEWDLYVDSTQDLAPFGELGDHIVGKTTLLTGLNKIGQTPKLTPDNHRIITHVTINIKPNMGTKKLGRTGPKSIPGKKRSSMNALKHGAYSQAVLMPSEDANEYERKVSAYQRSLKVTSELGKDLARLAADHCWVADRMKIQLAISQKKCYSPVNPVEFAKHLGIPNSLAQKAPSFLVNPSYELPSEDRDHALKICEQITLLKFQLPWGGSYEEFSTTFPELKSVLNDYLEEKELVPLLGADYCEESGWVWNHGVLDVWNLDAIYPGYFYRANFDQYKDQLRIYIEEMHIAKLKSTPSSELRAIESMKERSQKELNALRSSLQLAMNYSKLERAQAEHHRARNKKGNEIPNSDFKSDT